MLPAPIPDNDNERLAALHALLILDTPPEQRFNRIVEFAAREFDNPLVTGEPFIRFYAGAPLHLRSGHVIGTLCLIDTRVHMLDAIELSILSTLRDLVVQEIEAPAGALSR
jgi:GAF domain-containing protein